MASRYHAPTQRRYRQKLKREALEAYGNECECCGENNSVFLCIDHLNGNGNKHRREVGYGDTFFQWLRREKYPSGFRVLCWNCNMAIHFLGHCPHQGEES